MILILKNSAYGIWTGGCKSIGHVSVFLDARDASFEGIAFERMLMKLGCRFLLQAMCSITRMRLRPRVQHSRFFGFD